MNVEQLISLARQRVSGRVPRYIDMDAAVKDSRQDIVDMTIEKVQFAMEQAILGAQSILRSTCQEYIEALYVTDDLRIAIRQEKAYLEDGFDRREMLDDLLNSPKAKTSKIDGDKYVIIPLRQKPDANITQAISKKTSELFVKGRESKASSTTLQRMVSDMQNLTRRSSNAPVAARGASEKAFAVASEKQDPSKDWVHPGFQGVNQLEFINQQLQTDLQENAVRLIEDAVNRMRR